MMKKALPFLTFVLLAAISFPAQDLRKRAEENPFDCALYLLSRDKDAVDTHRLPKILVKAGRFDDAVFVIDLDEALRSKVELYSSIAKELIESNQMEAAHRFLTKAMTAFRKGEDWSERSNALLAANLVKVNRSEEALEILAQQEDDESKAKILIALARVYFDLNRKETAEKLLDDAFAVRQAFENRYLTFDLIDLFIKNGAHQKAAEYLQQAVNDLSGIRDETERRREILRFLPLFFKNKQKQKAFELWNEAADKDDSTDSLNLVGFLLKSNEIEDAAALFKKIRLNQDQSGSYGRSLIEIHLKFNDVKSALAVTLAMSNEPDDYFQQDSLLLIADKLIADKKTNGALNLLDLAYRKARRVGEEHLPEQSIGASPLTRKIIYLRNVRDRYFKLKRFDEGFNSIKALKIRDSHFQKFYSETLLELTKAQFKTLPRRKIEENLAKAVSIFDEDEDYQNTLARISAAEIYARIGDKRKAVEFLGQALKEAKESCCYLDEFLPLVGEVFEENKLEADSNMKLILWEIIKDSEN